MESAATYAELPPAHYRRSESAGASVDTTTVNSPRFERHCIAEFEWLARHDPLRLANLALTELAQDPVLLSQAAEAMAGSTRGPLMTRILLQLAEHPRPFVREAALAGLMPFFGSSVAARDRLHEMAENDPSPGVQQAAADILLIL